MPIPTDFWRTLRSQSCRPDQLLTDASSCLSYSYDNGRHRMLPGGVVLAESVLQIQQVIQCCGHYRLPVTARGRGTGTPGGAIPSAGGLVLSLERMTRILDFNPANRSITVEAGTLNQQVQDVAATQQLFWPPDPSSAAFCSIGGNIAYNAGGPRAVKYGATRDNVLAISAVTGCGDIIHTGSLNAKMACGFDLGRLLIGSEGTLAIITAATLRLLPQQPATATLQVWFSSEEAAAAIVPLLLQGPSTPCALEFMDQACLNLLRTHSAFAMPDAAQALLMIEVDGLPAALPEIIAMIRDLCQKNACLKIDSALTAAARQQLWLLRKALSPTLRKLAPHKINEDIVVPINRLAELLRELHDLAARYQFMMVNFGHIGSGNLHVNVLLPHLDAPMPARIEAYLNDLFHLVLRLEGCLSGEHGIGLDKKPFMSAAIDAPTLALMRSIKAQFDPLAILNPDKLFS